VETEGRVTELLLAGLLEWLLLSDCDTESWKNIIKKLNLTAPTKSFSIGQYIKN
jgi:hypothetical protein